MHLFIFNFLLYITFFDDKGWLGRAHAQEFFMGATLIRIYCTGQQLATQSDNGKLIKHGSAVHYSRIP